jgi:hypothetical protein
MEMTELLLKLAGNRFKNSAFTFEPTSGGLYLKGDKNVVEWAARLIKNMKGQ